MKYRIGLLIMLAVFAAGSFMPAPAAGKETKKTKVDVPQAVYDAFTKAYPDAKIIGSGKEKLDGETVFGIKSKDGGVIRDVIYKEDGTLVEIDEKIPPTALPLGVLQGIKSAYPTGETVKAQRITRGKTVEYELRLKQDSDYFELTVSSAGQITKTKQLTHQDEEKDNEIENE